MDFVHQHAWRLPSIDLRQLNRIALERKKFPERWADRCASMLLDHPVADGHPPPPPLVCRWTERRNNLKHVPPARLSGAASESQPETLQSAAAAPTLDCLIDWFFSTQWGASPAANSRLGGGDDGGLRDSLGDRSQRDAGMLPQVGITLVAEQATRGRPGLAESVAPSSRLPLLEADVCAGERILHDHQPGNGEPKGSPLRIILPLAPSDGHAVRTGKIDAHLRQTHHERPAPSDGLRRCCRRTTACRAIQSSWPQAAR